MMHPRPKIGICTPIPFVTETKGGIKFQRLARITTEWHRARMLLKPPRGYDVVEICCDGHEVGEARCQAIKHAREEVGCEFLFFLDYDVLPAPGCLQQLIYRAEATHPDFEVYSGIYCFKEHPVGPMIYKGWGNGSYWDWNFGDVLTEGIVNSGMGCALLRLSLFDRLSNTPENPWFLTKQHESGATITEDCWFTKRLTEEIGGKILVDCSNQCFCGHQDIATGEIFCLEPDAPPVVRAGIKPQ